MFFKYVSQNVYDVMPIIYTPTVGLACQMFSHIYRRPKGLYISIKDKGHVYQVIRNWPNPDVRAIVVTDGERILGLGDLGINGMGIPIGKLALCTALAGIKPQYCLPITLDCGTNTQKILDDPFYNGYKMKRVRGKEYDDFLDEFMESVVKRFGHNCLIMFEDFGNKNAFKLLKKYQTHYTVFNDDIQGTGSVVIAGLLAATRVTKKKFSDNVYLFQGAGEANIGIAQQCVMVMEKEGITADEARSKIWMVDSKGLLTKDRGGGGITSHKAPFAHAGAPIKTLLEAVKEIKPSILIGAAAVAGAFTKEILQEMAKNNPQPIIFALSNPTSKAECSAQDAYTHTNGTCLYASGSPFPPVKFKDKLFEPRQGNNAYIFPGAALAVTCAGIKCVTDEAFLVMAKTLADIVTDDDLKKGALYPPLKDLRKVSLQVATSFVNYAYEQEIASIFPEPENKQDFIRKQMYDLDEEPSFPNTYELKV